MTVVIVLYNGNVLVFGLTILDIKSINQIYLKRGQTHNKKKLINQWPSISLHA